MIIILSFSLSICFTYTASSTVELLCGAYNDLLKLVHGHLLWALALVDFLYDVPQYLDLFLFGFQLLLEIIDLIIWISDALFMIWRSRGSDAAFDWSPHVLLLVLEFFISQDLLHALQLRLESVVHVVPFLPLFFLFLALSFPLLIEPLSFVFMLFILTYDYSFKFVHFKLLLLDDLPQLFFLFLHIINFFFRDFHLHTSLI